MLALEHIRQRLEGTLAAAPYRFGTPAVVEQRIHRLLQHALLVPKNDLRRAVLHQFLEPVVTVDHAPVKIVEIARGKAPAIERNKRPQIGGNDRDHVENHPHRIVAFFSF